MSKSTRNTGTPWTTSANAELRRLSFTDGGRVTFCGTPDLVKFLSAYGLPASTHTITLP